MKTWKLFLIILFPMFLGYSQYPLNNVPESSGTLVQEVVAHTHIDHWWKKMKSNLVITSIDSTQILSLSIRDTTDRDDTFEVSFDLADLNKKGTNNSFVTDNEKFNELLKIRVDSSFSQYTGGKIILSVYKKQGWVKDSLYVKKRDNQKGFEISQLVNKNTYKKINTITILLNFWATKVDEYIPN